MLTNNVEGPGVRVFYVGDTSVNWQLVYAFGTLTNNVEYPGVRSSIIADFL
jgi:hypothetical protein